MDYFDFLNLQFKNEQELKAAQAKHDRLIQISFIILALVCIAAITILILKVC